MVSLTNDLKERSCFGGGWTFMLLVGCGRGVASSKHGGVVHTHVHEHPQPACAQHLHAVATSAPLLFSGFWVR